MAKTKTESNNENSGGNIFLMKMETESGIKTAIICLTLSIQQTGKMCIRDRCRKCQHECKQSFRAVVVDCTKYLSKRSKKKDKTAGNGKIP